MNTQLDLCSILPVRFIASVTVKRRICMTAGSERWPFADGVLLPVRKIAFVGGYHSESVFYSSSAVVTWILEKISVFERIRNTRKLATATESIKYTAIMSVYARICSSYQLAA
jgi:hypothetical protein